MLEARLAMEMRSVFSEKCPEDILQCPTVVESGRLNRSTVLIISVVDGLWALHVRSRVS